MSAKERCAPDVTRGEVYQGLLKKIGNYTFDYASVEIDGEIHDTHLTEDHHYKQVIDWVMDGYCPKVTAFFCWGVGGGPTETFSWTNIKNRYIKWTGSEWEVTNETLHERV